MKAIPVLFKFFFAGFFAYLFLFTLELKITLFDAYDYMVMAKYNAGFDNWYPFLILTRPPLLPVLLTPLASLHHLGVSFESIFTLMHLFSLLISGGFILASYFLFRKGLRPEFAALGAFFLMIQPGFVAYSFETMADIPAGLLMIFSVFIYLSYRRAQSAGKLIFLCFVTALGVAMKYPMVLAPMVFIGAHMILSLIEGNNWKQIIADPFYWLMGLLSAAMYVAISVISLFPLHGWTLENVNRALQPYLDHIFAVPAFEESMTANVSFLFAQMTAPLALLTCAGLMMILRRNNEFNMVMFMWLVVFLLIASVIGAHFEYRYLFPLIPACYFFSAFAMQESFDYARKKWSKKKFFPFAASAILILLTTLPALGFARELISLNSGFYQNDFHRRVAKATIRGNDFIWIGPKYPMYQKEAPFHPKDPYYKIYHFWATGITFYTGKTPKLFHNKMHYSWIDSINDGDILVYDPLHFVLETAFLIPPEKIPPLSVGKIFPMKFTLDTESGNKKIFVSKGNQIELDFNKEDAFTIKITGETPLTQKYFIWFKLEPTPNLPSSSKSKAIYQFSNNLIWIVESKRDYFDSIKEVALLNFESEDFYFTR